MSTTHERMAVAPFDAATYGSRGLHIVRGEGVHVFDDAGNAYLDATSQYGVASLGHCHPEVVTAVQRQAATLISCFGSYRQPVREELHAALVEQLEGPDRVFLCNSGSEALEAAFKFARLATGRSGVVAVARGFHGRTLGALSASSRSKHREAFAPLVPGFEHVRPGDVDALQDRLASGEVAAMVCEIIQGEGGVHVLESDYLQRARALCREHGVLFIADEVQTGVGRTGAFTASSALGLQPDIVCLAKGLGGGVPIGAMAYRAECGRFPVGSHGSTFGGNPLAASAALAVVRYLVREQLCERVSALGDAWIQQLRDRLGPSESGPVRDVRGRGFMVGIELVGPSAPVQRELQERGFLVLGAGPRTLRLLPPLIIEEAELNELASALEHAISGVAP